MKNALPSKEDIIQLLDELEPITKGSDLSITLDINGKYPGTIDITQIRNILQDTQDNQEIAERVIEHCQPSGKQRKKRKDAYFTKRKGKFTGRGKDSSYKQIIAMFTDKNLDRWKKLSYAVCSQDQVEVIVQAFTEQQAEEFVLIMDFMEKFKKKVLQAQEHRKSEDISFLNNVIQVFGNDAREFITGYTKAQGRTISDTALQDRWKAFLKWYRCLPTKKRARMKKINRERTTGIVYMAWMIHKVMYVYRDALQGLKIEEVKNKMEEYHLTPQDLL